MNMFVRQSSLQTSYDMRRVFNVHSTLQLIQPRFSILLPSISSLLPSFGPQGGTYRFGFETGTRTGESRFVACYDVREVFLCRHLGGELDVSQGRGGREGDAR